MAKLLLVAPGGDPDDVGESWVVHQWVSSLSALHDTTLLTYHKRTRAPLAGRLTGLRVVEWSDPPLVHKAERLNSMLKPGYLPFYFRARRWIAHATAQGERFDIAHQLAPVAMRYPSPLTGMGIPYLIGPVGGSLESPGGFTKAESQPWYVGLRSFDQFRLRRDPMLRRSYAEADCLIGTAPYVRELLGDITLRRFEVMTDTGVPAMPEPVDRAGRDGPVRLLFVGRLVRTKGVLEAIRAMALLRDLPATLDIVGQGVEAPACEALVAELGLADRVRLHGHRSREEVMDFYRAADVFFFPSYREPGGLVVAEAMSYGLPCIVNDLGGPGTTVDDDSGIRVHAIDESRYVQDLAAAARTLVADKQQRLRLGSGARARVADVGLWSRKLQRMTQIYQDILEDAGR